MLVVHGRELACASCKWQISCINVCLRTTGGLPERGKKVSGAPDKYWVPLPSLQQHMCHLRCANTVCLSLVVDPLLAPFSPSWEFSLSIENQL